MKIKILFLLAAFFTSCEVQKQNMRFVQKGNYACSLKITGKWKRDSLDWHKKKLLKRNIKFDYTDLETNEEGYIKCLNISVKFPDMVSGSVGNCGNIKSLQNFSYSIGFERDSIISKQKGFKIGYFDLRKDKNCRQQKLKRH